MGNFRILPWKMRELKYFTMEINDFTSNLNIPGLKCIPNIATGTSWCLYDLWVNLCKTGSRILPEKCSFFSGLSNVNMSMIKIWDEKNDQNVIFLSMNNEEIAKKSSAVVPFKETSLKQRTAWYFVTKKWIGSTQNHPPKAPKVSPLDDEPPTEISHQGEKHPPKKHGPKKKGGKFPAKPRFRWTGCFIWTGEGINMD